MAKKNTKAVKDLATLEVGDLVTLYTFTGMQLKDYPIETATKKTIKITNAKGYELVFDRATGTQTNVENAKYANRIAPVGAAKPGKADVADEDEEVTPKKKKTVKAAAPAKKTKKAAPVVDEDDEYEDEDDEDDED